ncbi:MAG TPA: hypothetical protein VF226_10035 [Hyphomicrobiaceae bacterium]
MRSGDCEVNLVAPGLAAGRPRRPRSTKSNFAFCGRICLVAAKSTSASSSPGGVREVDDQVWQVSFLGYDLGYFDTDKDRVEQIPTRSPRRKFGRPE